jgi:hypothetical protein
MTKEDTQCGPGEILRKGYTRKFKPEVKALGYTVRKGAKVYTVRPKRNAITVKAACIKNRGLHGKGPAAKGIGPLRKGELIKYGYSYRLSDAVRHSALKKAIERYGALSVYHKLDAVAKLAVRTAPDASKIFTLDREWVRANHDIKK